MIADAYVFDAYGTLFDVHSAIRRHVEAIGLRGERLSELWRQKQLEYTWVRSLAGRYRDFAALTEEALDFALATLAPDCVHLKPALLDAYRHLEPYPEVARVLARLKAQGKRTAILSNGTPAMLAENSASAGISQFVDVTFSVDALGTYKTAPEIYAYAIARLAAAPEAISFQSSNRWDVAGAVAAGLRAVWVNRRGQVDEYQDLAPVAVIASLDDLEDLE